LAMASTVAESRPPESRTMARFFMGEALQCKSGRPAF
jgi:hypothetical protein